MAAEIAEAKNPLVMSLARLGEAVYRLVDFQHFATGRVRGELPS